MDVDKAIKSRKSVREYTKDNPDWREIIEAIDNARYAPAAGNNFVTKFILVKEKNKIQALADAANQSFIATAPYVVVVCSNPDRLVKAYGEEQGKIYSRQQAGASIQNFLLSLESKGINSCWVGYFDDHEVRRELKIKDNLNLEAIFPIGYEPKKTKKKKTKIELDRILFFGTYGTKKMKMPKDKET